MYQLNFSKDIDLINWNVLYYGIEKELISPDTAIDYANKLIEKNPQEDNPYIIELLIVENADKDNILQLLSKILSAKNPSQDFSMLILRYAILLDIKRRIKGNKKLLSAIESVYADFDYPSDMESFISYMPVQDESYDTSKHTQKENEQRLVDNFNEFLVQKGKEITSFL